MIHIWAYIPAVVGVSTNNHWPKLKCINFALHSRYLKKNQQIEDREKHLLKPFLTLSFLSYPLPLRHCRQRKEALTPWPLNRSQRFSNRIMAG
jgi:hypothetical protein